MNPRILEAYVSYSGEMARRGMLDHSLDVALLEGKTVEEHMIDVLRAAGRLPDGWDQDEPEPARQSA
jgi:hypothetical protein